MPGKSKRLPLRIPYIVDAVGYGGGAGRRPGSKAIAFPAVGTGIAGFPIEERASILLHEAAQHLKGETALEKIYFVLFDHRALMHLRTHGKN